MRLSILLVATLALASTTMAHPEGKPLKYINAGELANFQSSNSVYYKDHSIPAYQLAGADGIKGPLATLPFGEFIEEGLPSFVKTANSLMDNVHYCSTRNANEMLPCYRYISKTILHHDPSSKGLESFDKFIFSHVTSSPKRFFNKKNVDPLFNHPPGGLGGFDTRGIPEQKPGPLNFIRLARFENLQKPYFTLINSLENPTQVSDMVVNDILSGTSKLIRSLFISLQKSMEMVADNPYNRPPTKVQREALDEGKRHYATYTQGVITLVKDWERREHRPSSPNPSSGRQSPVHPRRRVSFMVGPAKMHSYSDSSYSSDEE
ncbi:MAG: hypothetical protein DHS80DRAFT_30592 [Piptocephalis tieghemiana]|nr:MAG: hypothetical protein DHS80DRAFT_30592 [Piptocephalis tieghemiana]